MLLRSRHGRRRGASEKGEGTNKLFSYAMDARLACQLTRRCRREQPRGGATDTSSPLRTRNVRDLSQPLRRGLSPPGVSGDTHQSRSMCVLRHEAARGTVLPTRVSGRTPLRGRVRGGRHRPRRGGERGVGEDEGEGEDGRQGRGGESAGGAVTRRRAVANGRSFWAAYNRSARREKSEALLPRWHHRVWSRAML